MNGVGGSDVPGLQYVVVNADAALFEYAGGWADLQQQQPMTPDTTLMAYSMTKTFTAVAVLQLVEQGKVGLEDELDQYLPDTPYAGRGITIGQLLAHTSGLPNPIPLGWVHLAADDAGFDEMTALTDVLQDNPDLAFEPGERFAYANIGYWLLGPVIEQASGQPYTDYMRANVLSPLGLAPAVMDFTIPDAARHANGYLAKFSWMNLLKGFLIERQYVGGYEGNGLRLESHHLNGPAFGGLVGSARGFSRFLQDQLQPQSTLLGMESQVLLETAQADSAGRPVPMTLGWHVGATGGLSYLFKEGGGGGFHAEMRLYPALGMGTVVMVNSTEFNSTAFLDRVDQAFFGSAASAAMERAP